MILTLTCGLAAAWFFGLITHRLRLSPIVGYLAAGIALALLTPRFVADRHIAEQLAEIGVVLLMFGVGLQFHVRELLAVWRLAVPGAVAQIAVSTLLGALMTSAFGWSPQAGIIFGLAISVASTVVLVRVLADHDTLHTPAGHIAVGWLLIEDVFTVVVVLLPLVAESAGSVSATTVLLSIGARCSSSPARRVHVAHRSTGDPEALEYVERTRSRELFTLTILVIALGIAVGSAFVFGASMALGAFLAGIVVGQSELSTRAASEALPFRDAFTVLFFVAVGMLFDPTQLARTWPLALATLGIVLVGKPLAAFVAVVLMRSSTYVAVTVAIALAQIGELSFMLGALALELDVLPSSAMQAIVAASIVSITLNPFLFRPTPSLGRWTARLGGPTRVEHAARATVPTDAIVVGYGRVGETVVRVLREQRLTPMVVEMNLKTVQRLQREGMHAVHGDAALPDVLEDTAIDRARHLVFTAATSPDAVIRVAKLARPDVTVIARTAHFSEVSTLHHAGADVVVSAEGELALALASRLLELLGATPEQLDRARDRLLAEIAPPTAPGGTHAPPQAT